MLPDIQKINSGKLRQNIITGQRMIWRSPVLDAFIQFFKPDVFSDFFAKNASSSPILQLAQQTIPNLLLETQTKAVTSTEIHLSHGGYMML